MTHDSMPSKKHMRLFKSVVKNEMFNTTLYRNLEAEPLGFVKVIPTLVNYFKNFR
jgi:hypothetical protein